MLLHYALLLFGCSQGQTLISNDFNRRLSSMETKIAQLESEVKILKSKNDDLESKIVLKEIQADVSYLMMEQVKINDRSGLSGR